MSGGLGIIMTQEQRAFTREDRKLQIITAMLIRAERGAQPHTTYSLAAALNMRVSPHFRRIVDELVKARLVNKIETAHRPKWRKYLLEPNMVLIKRSYGEVWKLHARRKKNRNKVIVNSGGKQVEMFANWRR
jgi:hypothetical protein